MRTPPPALILLLRFFMAGLLFMMMARICLVIWQADRVMASGLGIQLFVQGLRVDIIMMSLVVLLPALALPMAWTPRLWLPWRTTTVYWLAVATSLLVFMEASTPAFLLQYEVRPNRLFFEYLAWPGETLRMLWGGFRFQVLASAGAMVVVALVLRQWTRKQLATLSYRKPGWLTIAIWPLLLLTLTLAIRSTLDHRPVNPAYFTPGSDNLVNQLILNSTWSLAHAVYNLKHEQGTDNAYGDMPDRAMFEQVKATAVTYDGTVFLDDAANPLLRYQPSSRTDARRLNLVIILEESLGATYVGSLNGIAGLTPQLERLAAEGWWFENLYATGTRSARGIEAVVTGFLPTRGRSVVKLLGSQGGFFTLASLLKTEGYSSEFIYGGEAQFDNMAGFFLANGFDRVIDKRDFPNPVFEGSWGASDEDVFTMADKRLLEQHGENVMSFTLVFTSSNHSPFDFPEGRIEAYESPLATENNAIRYADHALGQFIKVAQTREYWQDTVFIIVADHDNQVVGSNLVPVEHFHIPGLILGADITPRRIRTVASQIDLPTTALSLIGVDAIHPMLGRDFTRVQDDVDGRAMMQFGDRFAWMENDSLVILSPENPPSFAQYNAAEKSVIPARTPQPAAAKRALAHAMLPAWLYRKNRYSAAPGH